MQKSEPNGPYGISVLVEFELKVSQDQEFYANTALVLAIGYVLNHARGASEIELKRLAKDVEKAMEKSLTWIHKPKVTLSYKPPEVSAEDDAT